MKKILFFIPNLMHGGAEKVLVNLANNLDKSKYEVTIKTVFDSGINKEFLSTDIKYEYCVKRQFRGNSHFFKLFSPKFLYKKWIKGDYDIVVSYLEGMTARIIAGCPNPKTRKICWFHGEQKTKETISYAFRSFKECERTYNAFDKLVCVSQGVKSDICSLLQLKKEPIVLYNTNETEQMQEKARESCDIEFDKNKINLCGVGKIHETKGFMRLARIHKRLRDEGITNYHIYILGVGKQQGEIEEYLRKNNLSDSYTFLGYQKNPYKYVSKCDLYVCPSVREGFSTAATEALVLGLAVLTTRVSGMTEMLGENNEYGVIVDNDEESFCQGLKRFVEDAELLGHYKRQAAIRGKAFAKEKTVAAVQDMFKEV